jgi:hypothetical protein
MSTKEYDLVTIGAGSGGVRASRFAAQYYNAKVAVVELPFGFVSSDDIGGALILYWLWFSHSSSLCLNAHQLLGTFLPLELQPGSSHTACSFCCRTRYIDRGRQLQQQQHACSVPLVPL